MILTSCQWSFPLLLERQHFLLLAVPCLSLLEKPSKKFSQILPLSPSPCPSLTSNHIFIFLDKMLSFIYQLLFPSFFSFDYFSRSCLEALTITDVQNSQIWSHSLVFWFFLLYSNAEVPVAGKYFYVHYLSWQKYPSLAEGKECSWLYFHITIYQYYQLQEPWFPPWA